MNPVLPSLSGQAEVENPEESCGFSPYGDTAQLENKRISEIAIITLYNMITKYKNKFSIKIESITLCNCCS
jgi:hypothetical protein